MALAVVAMIPSTIQVRMILNCFILPPRNTRIPQRCGRCCAICINAEISRDLLLTRHTACPNGATISDPIILLWLKYAIELNSIYVM